jgi:hypothetical protein
MSEPVSALVDQMLHVLARILLRLYTPQRACVILERFGRLFPPYREHSDVLRAALRIGRRGTCLSRSLAIAARAREAELVIGVGRTTGGPFLAHAWLELSGAVVDPTRGIGVPFERLCRGRLRHVAAGRL